MRQRERERERERERYLHGESVYTLLQIYPEKRESAREKMKRESDVCSWRECVYADLNTLGEERGEGENERERESERT